MKKACACLLLVAALTGCATSGLGNAPSAERGARRSDQGERLPTETLTPGVGSALFPDPSWR